MKEPIKDFYNVIKGWVETKPNGDKVYYNFKKKRISILINCLF